MNSDDYDVRIGKTISCRYQPDKRDDWMATQSARNLPRVYGRLECRGESRAEVVPFRADAHYWIICCVTAKYLGCFWGGWSGHL